LVGKPEGKDHLKDLGVDGRIKIKLGFKKKDDGGGGGGGLDWIGVAQNRDKWRALLNAVMNLRVP
jgi:hypothetical protein